MTTMRGPGCFTSNHDWYGLQVGGVNAIGSAAVDNALQSPAGRFTDAVGRAGLFNLAVTLVAALLAFAAALAPALAPAPAQAGPGTLAILYFENTGNPELEPLKVGLGLAWIQRGRFGVAVDLIFKLPREGAETATGEPPDRLARWDAVAELGEALRELGRYEEALFPLERSADLVPDEAIAAASESGDHPFGAGHHVRAADPLAHVAHEKRTHEHAPHPVVPHGLHAQHIQNGYDPHGAGNIEI